MSIIIRQVIFLLIFPLFFNSLILHAAPLRVGVVEGPPFAMVQDGKPIGIAVDLWEEIARRGNIQYQFVKFSPKTDEILELLYKHELDIAIGPIAVTHQRIKKVDFTVGYFDNRVSLIVKKQSSFLWLALVSFFHSSFILIVGLLFLVFLLYTGIFWLFEREKHEDIPKKYSQAISYFFWESIFHRHFVPRPHTSWGKAGVLLWVTFTTLLFASLTASLASYYFMIIQSNEAGIRSTSGLHTKVLGAIKGRHEYEAALMVTSSVIPVKNDQEGLNMVKTGQIYGFVYDYHTARYLLDHESDTSALVVPDIVLDRHSFAFAVPYNDPLRVKINLILTDMEEEDMGSKICQPYLGKEATECEF
jgi:polar amino acid transport system substrate-binding protein